MSGQHIKTALFNTWQWVVILSTVITVGATVTAFAFNTFETKSEISEYITKRLDRIENKLDTLLAK